MVPVDRERGNGTPAETSGDGRDTRVVLAPHLLLGAVVLISVAWLFGFFLQHSFPAGAPGWWQAYFFRIPPAVLESLISWDVWRHLLIPGLVGCGWASLVGAGYVQKFYGVAERSAALSFLVDVVMATLFPAGERRPSSRTSGRHVAYAALLFTLLAIGTAALISAYGLFFALEPGSVQIYQFWAGLIAITWAVVMVFGLLWVLIQRLFRPTGGPVSVGLDNLEELRAKHVLLRVGGPGTLGVRESHAIAVTERNGRFLRVLGAGKHTLTPYETVRTVISLQTYVYDGEVEVFTRDGIRATIHLAVTYRIAADDALMRAAAVDTEAHDESVGQSPAPTPEQPFRYGEASVLAAAGIANVDGRGKVTKWHQLPFPVVAGQLRNAVSHYRLNELFVPDPGFETRRAAVHDEVLTGARQSLNPLGIDVIGIRLGPFEMGEPVLEGYLELWRAVWERREHVALAQSQASAIEELAPGHSEVEIAALQSMAETAQRVKKQNGLQNLRPLIALRLIDALERVASQSGGLTDRGSAELMAQLSELRRRLEEDAVSGGRGNSGR